MPLMFEFLSWHCLISQALQVMSHASPTLMVSPSMWCVLSSVGFSQHLTF